MNRPIILINEGCSMSSFTSRAVGGLIKIHGYPIEIPVRNELYVPSKNPNYREGMSTADLLEKTITESPNICFKLNFKFMKEPDCITLLKQKNARICFIERFNLLDCAICTLKDFGDFSLKQQKGLKFKGWRKSKARLEGKVDSSIVVGKLNELKAARQKKIKIMRKHTDQKEFIYAEDLCRLKINAYEDAFKTLGYKLDKNLTKKFLKKYEIKEAYKHKDVIDCSDIAEFKNELKQHGFFKYWRE